MPYTQGPVLAALGQAHNLASAPLPLDRIRARRMEREAADLEKFKADTQRQTSNEGVAAGTETRRQNKNAEEYQKILADELKKLPIIPPNATPEEKLKAYKARMDAAQSHYLRDINDMADAMGKNLPNYMGASPLDPNSGYGASKLNEMDNRTAATEISQGNLNVSRARLAEDKRQFDNKPPSGFMTLVNPKDTSQLQMVREASPEADAYAKQGWIELTELPGDTSLLTEGGISKAAAEVMAVEEQVLVLDELVKNTKELAMKPGVIRGTAGEIANMFTSVLSQVGQVTGKPFMQKGIIDAEYLNPDEKKLSKSTKAAILNGQIDANTVSIAFMLALVNNPDGRISDADVREAENMIKSNQGSIPVFLKSLDEVSRIAHVRLKAKTDVARKYGVLPPESAPPSDVPPEEWNLLLDKMTPAQRELFK